ncbi:hypothetical protein FOZ62_007725, partial [Perkinsus olseni]
RRRVSMWKESWRSSWSYDIVEMTRIITSTAAPITWVTAPPPPSRPSMMDHTVPCSNSIRSPPVQLHPWTIIPESWQSVAIRISGSPWRRRLFSTLVFELLRSVVLSPPSAS